MGKQIKAEIVADSIDNKNNRITSFLLTYPRFIHGEVMTHRMFSRNSASSRAIPFDKMVKMVKEDPFIPIAWQKDHKGMQGTEYIQNEYATSHTDPGDNDLDKCIEEWLYARNGAVLSAKKLNELGVTKQLCNRLFEPFMWHTVLVTATEFDNFFELRCPKYYSKNTKEYYRSKKDYLNAHAADFSPYGKIEWLKQSKSGAEIHIQALAESMWNAMSESTPNKLKPGEWHIPFGDNMNFTPKVGYYKGNTYINGTLVDNKELRDKIKVATARCARLSYMTFDNEIDYEKDIKLHDNLLESKHMSPFEHCAKAMTEDEYLGFHLMQGNNDPFDDDGKDIFGVCRNFKGFIPYRYLVENN